MRVYTDYALEIKFIFRLLTPFELKAFLGLFIAMGFNALPSVKDYWSEDWILGMPAFAKVMTRKRFLDLLYNIHVNDNSKMPAAGSDQFDKLYKSFLSLRT